MSIYHSLPDLIGNTPMLALDRLTEQWQLNAPIYAKLEYFNPQGSVKDRAALYMIDAAEKEGKLKPGGTIIEPTSGNTGIGLAYIAAVRGYHMILTMPDNMSLERRNMLAALGAELVLTPAAQGMNGAVVKAQELLDADPTAFMPGQFSNEANALSHYETTGPEILTDMENDVDIFVASVGTGGTLTGVGRKLREVNPNVKIVAVEPAASPLLSGGKAGPHKIQGIGANFIPELLDQKIYDQVIPVTDEDAYAAARAVAKAEGLMVGISSGAVLWACAQLAKDPANAGKRIVTVFPDTGLRYLSVSGLY
jgi:cysteine synthase A